MKKKSKKTLRRLSLSLNSGGGGGGGPPSFLFHYVVLGIRFLHLTFGSSCTLLALDSSVVWFSLLFTLFYVNKYLEGQRINSFRRVTLMPMQLLEVLDCIQSQ